MKTKFFEKISYVKWCFLLPTLIFLMAMAIFPLIWSLSLSFFRWKAAAALPKTFLGFLNYYQIFFKDARFWNSLRFTIMYAVIGVSIELFLGMGLANLLNGKIKFRNFFRILFLLPMASPPIAVAFIWRMLFHPDQGVINKILNMSFGIVPIKWLTSAKVAPFSLIIVDIWEWTPFMFLALLAALQSLPTEIYDAASVDGASKRQAFLHITFPLLLPIVTTLVLLRGIDSFKLFDLVFGITGGGPGISTESLSYYIYSVGLSYFDVGYACSLSWVFLLLTLAISMFLINRLRKRI